MLGFISISKTIFCRLESIFSYNKLAPKGIQKVIKAQARKVIRAQARRWPQHLAPLSLAPLYRARLLVPCTRHLLEAHRLSHYTLTQSSNTCIESIGPALWPGPDTYSLQIFYFFIKPSQFCLDLIKFALLDVYKF